MSIKWVMKVKMGTSGEDEVLRGQREQEHRDTTRVFFSERGQRSGSGINTSTYKPFAQAQDTGYKYILFTQSE